MAVPRSGPLVRVPLFRTAIGEEAVDAVAEALRSGWIGSGARVEQFETEFAATVDAAHCVAVSSGTAALHMALRVLDLEPGTEVITTPLTWLATHHAILYERCVPVLADIDPASGNIDPARVAELIGERTGAILAVHYGGVPCDLGALRSLGVPLIEDCAHAVGASFAGQPIGSGANLQCFSFSPTKNLTTADGGAIVTGDDDQAQRLRRLRSLGVRRTIADGIRTGRSYRDAYEVDEPGFRYEMNELHAAIGLAQLPLVAGEVARRREIAAEYRAALQDVAGIELLRDHPGSGHHLFVVLAERREELADALQSRGVGTGIHYPVNDLLRTAPGALPAMDRFAARTLSLPLHPSMTADDVATVVDAVQAGW